jgi:hypothetical protein
VHLLHNTDHEHSMTCYEARPTGSNHPTAQWCCGSPQHLNIFTS